MFPIKHTPTARFLALTTILGLIFAFLLTPTLAVTPHTYQTSRFASDESVDDSVRKYAQNAEEAGFILKRKQVGDEGRGWARLGRRQDEEGLKGVDESSDQTAIRVTSTSASALVTPGIENYLAAEDLTIPSIPEPSFGTYESFSTSSETSGGTPSSSSSTTSSETAGSSTSSSASTTMPGGYATATDFPPITSDEAESSSATAPGGYVTATEFPPVTSDGPASSSSSSATMPGGYATATEFPPIASDQPTSSSTSVSSSSQSQEPAPSPSVPPASEPAPSPEPAPQPASTSESQQPPPGPVETTLIPQGFSSIIPDTVVLTATASAKATTITRSSAGGDGVVMITGGTASKSTSAGPSGFVTITSTATSNGAIVTMTTTGAVRGAMTAAGASKTHTIVINPSQGMNKLIPFILHAEVGETVEFLEYSSSSADAPDPSLEEAEEEAKKLKVVQMELGQSCIPTLLDPFSTSVSSNGTTTSTIASSSVAGSSFVVSSLKPMLYGSADERVCEGGMVLLVNPLSANPGQKEEQQGQDKKVLVFADGVRVDGTGVKDVLHVWAGLTPENEQALKSFQSSSEMRPEAWAWGHEFGLGGLEGLKLDAVVQNILYTRLTLALNPSLLELYSNSTSATNTNATSTSSGALTAITEITAYDSLLSTLGSTSTSEVYGGNAAGTGTSLPAGNHHPNGAPEELVFSHSAPVVSCLFVCALCSR
ncbi:hypothetical protein FFLO_03958 [Filobasidium floriforme]|uniref:Uncharacterized protein n=1 Tax=Filobasidium floriforme TaxID=5210 RepID=A0A8K0JLB3_9TREE|nr:hypothetical protein FFLO_03958 [Filobasidium floriforme]